MLCCFIASLDKGLATEMRRRVLQLQRQILFKMSVVDVIGIYDDDDLDRLLRNVQLEEPETNDGGNDGNVHVNSQAPLFEAVWSPTNETPNGKAGLTPDEERDGERRQEGGPCQCPALTTPTNAFHAGNEHFSAGDELTC